MAGFGKQMILNYVGAAVAEVTVKLPKKKRPGLSTSARGTAAYLVQHSGYFGGITRRYKKTLGQCKLDLWEDSQ